MGLTKGSRGSDLNFLQSLGREQPSGARATGAVLRLRRLRRNYFDWDLIPEIIPSTGEIEQI